MAFSIGIKPFSLKGEDDEQITRNNKIKWEYNMKAFTGYTPSWQQFLPGGTRDSWLPLDEDLGRGIVVHPVRVNDPNDTCPYCTTRPIKASLATTLSLNLLM